MKLRYNRFDRERSFRSPADFAKYADKQQAEFEELGAPGNDQPWAAAISQGWAHAAAAARQRQATEETIQQSLLQNPVFQPKGPLVETLKNMVQQGRQSAANEITNYLRPTRDNRQAGQVPVGSLDARAEFATALAFEANSRRGKDMSLQAILGDHEDRLENALQADLVAMQEKNAEFEALRIKLDAHFEEMINQLDSTLEERTKAWEDAYDSFIEQLATETAVKLWSDRSVKHEGRYKDFRLASVIFGLTGLVFTLTWIFGGFAAALYVFPTDKTAQIASYTAGSLAFFTLFVWGLRVLIRSMISEDHLSTDASARSALAHTYLALTKEEAATKEDRAIILATLFAPVSDGLVKDDGMPALSPTAVVAQALTSPRA